MLLCWTHTSLEKISFLAHSLVLTLVCTIPALPCVFSEWPVTKHHKLHPKPIPQSVQMVHPSKGQAPSAKTSLVS